MDGWKTYKKKAKKVNLIDYISISLHMAVFLEILLYFYSSHITLRALRVNLYFVFELLQSLVNLS